MSQSLDRLFEKAKLGLNRKDIFFNEINIKFRAKPFYSDTLELPVKFNDRVLKLVL